ncbi:MAG TPA: hypothetical protein V6C72_09680 [Chroococcales cyanobacterium]
MPKIAELNITDLHQLDRVSKENRNRQKPGAEPQHGVNAAADPKGSKALQPLKIFEGTTVTIGSV